MQSGGTSRRRRQPIVRQMSCNAVFDSRSWRCMALRRRSPLHGARRRRSTPRRIGVRTAAGQNVQPFFEGWQRYPGWPISMWFGYLNRNFKEQLDIPVGPNNTFDPAGTWDSRPISIPDGSSSCSRSTCRRIGTKTRKLIWTVTANGRTSTRHRLAAAGMGSGRRRDPDERFSRRDAAGRSAQPIAPEITGSPDQTVGARQIRSS